MAIRKAIEDFLNGYRQAIIEDQRDKGIRASGASAESLRIEVDINGGRLYGAGYFAFQVAGRRPGGFPPVEAILEWIQAKGITAQGISNESLAFLIARKIARTGTDIYQGKRPGLNLEKKLEELLQQLGRQLLRDTRIEAQNKIKTSVK